MSAYAMIIESPFSDASMAASSGSSSCSLFDLSIEVHYLAFDLNILIHQVI